MLAALMADAVFIAAIFAEVLAALSILQPVHAIALREEFGPVLAFYRGQAVPYLAPGAQLFWRPAPPWYADACIFAAVLFFLFFIAQARNAMTPLGGAAGGSSRSDALIDWLLPVVLCALAALVLAPTLLALLTLPAAAFLGFRKLTGQPSWFELSRSYYLNILFLGVALGAVLIVQR